MNELTANIGARIVVALFFGLIGYGVVLAFINMFIMPFTKEKELQKAHEKGRVITANFLKSIHPKGAGSASEPRIWGIYEYQYNGKKYKYKNVYGISPPCQETLYFKKNPKNAKNRVSFGRMENGKFMLYLMMSLLIFISTWFFF